MSQFLASLLDAHERRVNVHFVQTLDDILGDELLRVDEFEVYRVAIASVDGFAAMGALRACVCKEPITAARTESMALKWRAA